MAFWLLACAAIPTALGRGLPPDFELVPISPALTNPTAMAFAPDGRIFIAEQRGIVWVVQDGALLSQPFIDLRPEANGQWDRGLIGIALDPDFNANHHVYLLYTVDPVFGPPDEPAEQATFGRLTRYTGTSASDGNIADLNSRTVLIGAQPHEGFPSCWSSHTVGALAFAPDGALLVSSGDGARFELADGGGNTPGCFEPPLFGKDEDIGAFRAQSLDSLAGKVLRIDPQTGGGLPDNPHFNGDPFSNRSRVWINGLRNPYRFSVRPMSAAPGTIYICDVGWDNYEEISVGYGGENFGWPCREGFSTTVIYPFMNPASGGCSTIETPQNPGPLTFPIMSWHHFNPSQSTPPGFAGQCATGGVFHQGDSYPAPYRGAYFFGDYSASWIKALKVDANDQPLAILDFTDQIPQPVAMANDPLTGDVCVLSITTGQVVRIRSFVGPGDVNRDGFVNFDDVLAIIQHWGPCKPPAICPEDLNGDGNVNFDDVLEVLLNWT